MSPRGLIDRRTFDPLHTDFSALIVFHTRFEGDVEVLWDY
jgi:hypothetical protein